MTDQRLRLLHEACFIFDDESRRPFKTARILFGYEQLCYMYFLFK